MSRKVKANMQSVGDIRKRLEKKEKEVQKFEMTQTLKRTQTTRAEREKERKATFVGFSCIRLRPGDEAGGVWANGEAGGDALVLRGERRGEGVSGARVYWYDRLLGAIHGDRQLWRKHLIQTGKRHYAHGISRIR